MMRQALKAIAGTLGVLWVAFMLWQQMAPHILQATSGQWLTVVLSGLVVWFICK